AAAGGNHAESADAGPENEALVSVGSFTIVDEARLARGLLKDAGIPCGLANEKSALGALHLMVPESHVEAALEVLGGEISEEELAAQAEAAGGEED
ncbi:MAG: putative prokaryotic signal transducing protein, partial [Bryobacterales bacterium]|nr:putative prokaryotic signal transducing protein [Bryobacterales bacterium]